jgi:hypothetical protein
MAHIAESVLVSAAEGSACDGAQIAQFCVGPPTGVVRLRSDFEVLLEIHGSGRPQRSTATRGSSPASFRPSGLVAAKGEYGAHASALSPQRAAREPSWKTFQGRPLLDRAGLSGLTDDAGSQVLQHACGPSRLFDGWLWSAAVVRDGLGVASPGPAGVVCLRQLHRAADRAVHRDPLRQTWVRPVGSGLD